MDIGVVNIVAYNMRCVLEVKCVLLIIDVVGKLLNVGFAGVFFVSCRKIFRLSVLYVYSKFYL